MDGYHNGTLKPITGCVLSNRLGLCYDMNDMKNDVCFLKCTASVTFDFFKISPAHMHKHTVPGDSPNITNIFHPSSTSVSIMWIPPTIPNGDIIVYTITINPSTSEQPFMTNGSMMSLRIYGLIPYNNYSISISANTSAGEGPTIHQQFRTPEAGMSQSLLSVFVPVLARW